MSDSGFGELPMLPADDLQGAACAEIGRVGAGGAAIGRAGQDIYCANTSEAGHPSHAVAQPGIQSGHTSLSRHTNLARLIKESYYAAFPSPGESQKGLESCSMMRVQRSYWEQLLSTRKPRQYSDVVVLIGLMELVRTRPKCSKMNCQP